MAKEVKIVELSFRTFADIRSSEERLASLLNDGWEIATAGGGVAEQTNTGFGLTSSPALRGFVILVRES